MPKFYIKRNANDPGLRSEPGEGGILTDGPSVRVLENELGMFAARPIGAFTSISRKVDHQGDAKGKLTLLIAAVDSRAWENRNEHDDEWPTVEITLDRPAVPVPIDVQIITLKRVLVDRWSLTWSSNDNNGNGTDFRESLWFHASHITKVALYDGNTATMANLD